MEGVVLVAVYPLSRKSKRDELYTEIEARKLAARFTKRYVAFRFVCFVFITFLGFV